MNRFKFRFASVLRYREIIEDGKRRDFGVAMSHLQHQENTLRGIDASISGHEKETAEQSKGTVSVRELQNRYNYARKLDQDRERQEEEIARAQEEVEKRRVDLVDATKQKKIFEKLEERDRERHDRDSRKEEQTLIDELTTQRFARNDFKKQ